MFFNFNFNMFPENCFCTSKEMKWVPMNFHGTKKLLPIVSMISGHGTEKLLSMGFETLGLAVTYLIC